MSLCARACAHEPVRMQPNNWQCRQHRKKQAKALRRKRSGFPVPDFRFSSAPKLCAQVRQPLRQPLRQPVRQPLRPSCAGNTVKTSKSAAPRGVSGSFFRVRPSSAPKLCAQALRPSSAPKLCAQALRPSSVPKCASHCASHCPLAAADPRLQKCTPFRTPPPHPTVTKGAPLDQARPT